MNKQPVMFNNDLLPIKSGDRPWRHGSYSQSYQLFYDIARDLEFPLHFCSPYDFNWGTGTVDGFYVPSDSGFVPVFEPVTPAFVFDKALGADPHSTAVIQHCEASGLPIYGPPALGRLCDDKWRMYQLFQEQSALSALLTQDPDDLVDDIHRFFDTMDKTYAHHENRAVVKPLAGFQSRGIHLITRTPHGLEMHMLFGGQMNHENIEHNLHTMSRVPYLIQAWVNTGAGIPGIGFEGEFHDVRFIFHINEPGNAEFIMLYVKTLNGMIYVPLDMFTLSDPFKVVTPVADRLAESLDYGVFSVDVMRDVTGNWFLTEINDQVGLSINFDNPTEIHEMTRFMEIYIADMKRLYHRFR